MYKTVTGDTFSLISRKVYGVESWASRISRANPGVIEPITAGTTLAIPEIPSDDLGKRATAPANVPDEVSLTVGGRRFRFWSSMRIIRALDSIDIVEFNAPFDPDAPDYREIFEPFTFKRMEIAVGGNPLFTGTLVSSPPVMGDNETTISASGYGLPGVLQDCTVPAGDELREFGGLNLQAIAKEVTAPFGLNVIFEADPGPVFETVSFTTATKILPFLAKLAKQRKLVINSTERGALRFLTAIESGVPIAQLQQGAPPVLSVLPFFNPQEYYSHITGIEPVLVGLAGSQFTVKNPFLPGVIRPLNFEAWDTETSNVKSAVEAKSGRMFGNMASYSVVVNTWRDPAGELWAPNTIISLLAPDAMVYSPYSFVIRSIEFSRDAVSESATLNLVIPGSFSGKLPTGLPWQA